MKISVIVTFLLLFVPCFMLGIDLFSYFTGFITAAMCWVVANNEI